LANFLLQNAQKYTPLTFIFDIGGSFQSLTTIFGGSYLNAGQEARDFTINPFSLPQTKENLQFLFSFFRVLIEGNEQRYRLDFKEERRLWDVFDLDLTEIVNRGPVSFTAFPFTSVRGKQGEKVAATQTETKLGTARSASPWPFLNLNCSPQAQPKGQPFTFNC
jgi:type IV secretory pathway VirB4 component